MICAWTYVYTVVDAAGRLIINFLSDLKFSIFFWIIQICVCLICFFMRVKNTLAYKLQWWRKMSNLK